MTVTRETQFEREFGEIARARSESFHRRAQAKLRQISMNRNTGLLLKNPREMKWRNMNRTRHFIQCYSLTNPGRQISLRRFRSLRMIHICAFAFRLSRHTMFDERRFQHIGDELQRRNVSPQRL